VFTFIPRKDQLDPFLEVKVGNSETVKAPLNYDLSDAEVSFTITNKNRVLINNEDLKLQFNTNENMIATDNYIIQVKLKEHILY